VFDNFYGTGHRGGPRCAVGRGLVLLEIDWQGARQVRATLPEARTIFILPPTRRALEERLNARSTDSAAVIQRRLQDAARHRALDRSSTTWSINDRFDRRSRTCRPSSGTRRWLRRAPGGQAFARPSAAAAKQISLQNRLA
jgi:guanylate kinase